MTCSIFYRRKRYNMNKNHVKEIAASLRYMYRAEKRHIQRSKLEASKLKTSDPIMKFLLDNGMRIIDEQLHAKDTYNYKLYNSIEEDKNSIYYDGCQLHNLLDTWVIHTDKDLEFIIRLFADIISRKIGIDYAVGWLLFWYNGKLYQNALWRFDSYSFKTLNKSYINVCKKMLDKGNFHFRKNSIKFKVGIKFEEEHAILYHDYNEPFDCEPFDTIYLHDFVQGGEYLYRIDILSSKNGEGKGNGAVISLTCNAITHKEKFIIDTVSILPGGGGIIAWHDEDPESSTYGQVYINYFDEIARRRRERE
jgi:hypothetical protein